MAGGTLLRFVNSRFSLRDSPAEKAEAARTISNDPLDPMLMTFECLVNKEPDILLLRDAAQGRLRTEAGRKQSFGEFRDRAKDGKIAKTRSSNGDQLQVGSTFNIRPPICLTYSPHQHLNMQ